MTSPSTIKGIKALLKSLNKKKIRESKSSNPVTLDDLVENGMERIDTSLFSLDDVIRELAVSVGTSSINDATQAPLPFDEAAITRQEQLFPDAEKAKNTGIKYEGGVILYKNAQGKHVTYHIENVDANLEKMIRSASRTRSQDLEILQQIIQNPGVKNGGDAIDFITNKAESPVKAHK